LLGTLVSFNEMVPVASAEPSFAPERPESCEEHATTVAIESAAATPTIQERG
jgi:hypothetical protein